MGQLDEFSVKGPWVLMGDFNYVLASDEMSSATGASNRFASWVERRALVDLGFVGNKFTWSHGVELETRKLARLDRVVCCDDWRLVFPLAVVKHLSHTHLDH